MLLEVAGLLVASGILLLVIGIFIARQYTLRAKLITAFLVIATMLSLLVFIGEAVRDALDPRRSY